MTCVLVCTSWAAASLFILLAEQNTNQKIEFMSRCYQSLGLWSTHGTLALCGRLGLGFCVRVCVCGGAWWGTHAVAQSEGLHGLHLIIYLHGWRICQLYAQFKEHLHS